MDIIFFGHPEFLGSQSMPKYVSMLRNGMLKKNHSVEVWAPREFFHRIPLPFPFRKWLGYVDQFVVFPTQVQKKIRKADPRTLFVFADQALGPWIPMVQDRPHVVHCHDFMAQRSALGEISENEIGITGKLYQLMIRKGYRKSRNFISVSEKTKTDLHRFLKAAPAASEVVYNGLNQKFLPADVTEVRASLKKKIGIDLSEGFILHVGGNQFYKNRKGVVKIYTTWRDLPSGKRLPLIMLGAAPPRELVDLAGKSQYSEDIHFLAKVPDEILKMAYQGASVFLFPSLEEGFGWPIAEAMASGCPVITTDAAPMNEVGGDSCFYIPRIQRGEDAEQWSKKSATVLEKVLNLPQEEHQNVIQKGLQNANRFDPETTINHIEAFYQRVLENHRV